MSACDWCFREVPVTWLVYDGDAEEEMRVCRACHDDYLYCLARGRIPQNPEDA